jgi:hypothetical protein
MKRTQPLISSLLLCLIAGCASNAKKEPANNQQANQSPGCSSIYILPISVKSEDKAECAKLADVELDKFRYDKSSDWLISGFGVLGVIGGGIYGASKMESICESSMKTCLQKKSYIFPK